MTEAGREAVADFAGRIAALRHQTDAARAALVNTTGSAGSPDGAVRATVDTGGVLTGIEFGAAAPDIAPAELAASVLHTVQRARVAALREAERRVADAVGESSEAVLVLRRQLAELDPPTPPSPSAPPPPSPPRPAAEDDDTDGGFAGRGR